MRINLSTLNHLQTFLDASDIEEVIRLAERVNTLESKWKRKLATTWEKLTEQTVESLEKTGKISGVQDILEELFMEHCLDIMAAAIVSTRKRPKLPSKLAAYPKGPMPRSLKDLRKLWDRWRTEGEVPPRQKKIVERVKKAYVRKCQSAWEKYSRDFRAGDRIDKAEIIAKVQKAAQTEFARSKMIVETETTRYWNQTRRDMYDEAEDVTHYLFVPIRDSATTPWCYVGNHPDGKKRGRGMLVYKKGDPLLDKETPPIHWNCRSELLPLTRMNERHRKLIEDKSKARREHQCEPLPPGWNS